MASVRYFGGLWMTFNEEPQGQISAVQYLVKLLFQNNVSELCIEKKNRFFRFKTFFFPKQSFKKTFFPLKIHWDA